MIRFACIGALLCLPACAQPVLYACASFTKEYVVGAKLPPSGLFERTAKGEWRHKGFNTPFVFGLDATSNDPATLYLAAGNGLIRAAERWTILTGSDVTELRDVAVDSKSQNTIYFAHTAGIRVTNDGGSSWRELGASLHRHYTETIRVDPRDSKTLVAGGEEGIFRSADAGTTWKLAGAAGFQILRIEPSPHDPCFWLATTQQGGIFASHDCARSFENLGSLGVGQNLYDVAFDPTQRERIAIAGWGPGVAISSDNGKTWVLRNSGLPRPEVTSITFDPRNPGRLFAAVHEEAVYVSGDCGLKWTKDGLEGAHVNRLRFLPGGRPR